MGSERQSLIDVELARTEFRLDVLKLRERLGSIVPALRPKSSPAPTATVPPAPAAGEKEPRTPAPATSASA
jgi:hypothetical protein